jgi:L-lactate utilization protein LutB
MPHLPLNMSPMKMISMTKKKARKEIGKIWKEREKKRGRKKTMIKKEKEWIKRHKKWATMKGNNSYFILFFVVVLMGHSFLEHNNIN